MSKSFIKEAFQRHPRPQLPTKATLFKKTRNITENTTRASESSLETIEIQANTGLNRMIHQVSPWKTLLHLGDLVQTWSLCVSKASMSMVKRVDETVGQKELEKMEFLGHTNINVVWEAFRQGSAIYLHTYQLQVSYIPELHWPLAVWQTTELTANCDLEMLGYTLLECINTNKLFGLIDSERWSGFKIFVNFLDELINEKKLALAKLDCPHQFILQPPDYAVLLPLLELVPLECFTL
ncbi:hypothetical protein P154DRAFT_545808 [Amniculicola lignicola CBS 123094]|uniref:Uncharacterized protein n=1 Tax=Amniculicola lignicola CBS 123094 TaxID=1392246 RepID=A0A6A5WHD9_9PLEO|nr:hypothetical protein P154DRAFT_545808 [Amniculicola lignicola CBS 123094]